MTSKKILAPPYTTTISETLSQKPLNQTLLRADICENVSDIAVVYGGARIFLDVIVEALLIVGVFYRRSNNRS